ncbi:MAG TPA: CHASE2 domain-containing protein, partial [Gallionella sp.]|nr:CHASE2 domain-containing protein [Gallionella sp.]
MNKWSVWKKDWFVGLLVALTFLAGARSDLVQSLERKAYDLGVQASSRAPSDRIAVIAIDDQSIANLGRWPWPREVHARMLDVLAAGHPKVIGYTAFFFEPQVDAGLIYIHKIAELLGKQALLAGAQSGVAASGVVAAQPVAEVAQGAEVPVVPEPLSPLDVTLLEAAKNLDNDQKLADSMARVNDVLLAMFFNLGQPQGKPGQPLPDYALRNALPNVQAGGSGANPLPAQGVLLPISRLGSKALAIGHLNNNPDVDGAVRTEPLAVNYYGQYYPSLSLMLAARSLNLAAADIRVVLGESVQLGNRKIATDAASQMHTHFYRDRDGHPAFPVDSFYDVLTGKIPAEKYRDKIVLIGATAAGVGSLQITPVSPGMAPVLALAHSVSGILNGDFFVVPGWAGLAESGVFLLVALYLILLLPRLGAAVGALVTGGLFAALLGTHFALMTTQALWLQLMLPAALLLVGHLLLTTKRHLLTEKGKQKSDA